jgi:hypothetical protein
MAGRLITVVGKQQFQHNFGSTGNPVTILGNRFFDVRDAVSGVLLVRVASVSGIPTGGTFSVSLNNAMVMADDPATIYAITSGSSAIASVTISPSDGFPRLYAAGFTTSSSPPCGPMVGFGLQPVYGSAAGTGTITMACELLVRDT